MYFNTTYGERVRLSVFNPGEQPYELIDRNKNETWQVLDSVIDPSRLDSPQPQWALVRDGDHVRIPLFSYQLSMDLTDAMIYIASLGLHVMAEVRLMHNRPPKRVHISRGDYVEDLRVVHVNAFRYHIGFAVQVY